MSLSLSKELRLSQKRHLFANDSLPRETWLEMARLLQMIVKLRQESVKLRQEIASAWICHNVILEKDEPTVTE